MLTNHNPQILKPLKTMSISPSTLNINLNLPKCTTIFSILLCFTFLTATSVSATDHIVGANKGWNPGMNYTLWANNKTFLIGDYISFRYQKNQYNVFEVNKTGYDNCTIEGALGNWSSGKDFIMLMEAKRYYFICGTGGCFSGMKVSVIVHPLASPPKATEHSSKESFASSLGSGSVGAMAVCVFGLILFGYGWI